MSRLLVVAEQMWPTVGGGTLATNILLQSLLYEPDIEVTVVSGTEHPEKLFGASYMYAPILSTTNKIELWMNLVSMSRSPWFARLVERADVVYIPRYCYPLVYLLRRSGKRTVVHLHDYQPVSFNACVLDSSHHGASRLVRDDVKFEILESRGGRRALLSGLFSTLTPAGERMVSHADALICVSRRQRDIISSMAPDLDQRMTVIHNPAPSPQGTVGARPDAGNILYVGGDSRIKGFNLFMRASESIIASGRDVRFFLTRSYREEHTKLFHRLNKGFGERYRLLGIVPPAQMRDVYSASAALLFPSIWEEPLPYAVMEAMLAERVPIASIVGGIPEMIGGTFADSLAFKAGDIEGLCIGIETVLAMSPEGLLDKGAALREVAITRFDPDRIGREFEKTLLG